MRDELVELFEGPGIEEQFDAFAGGQLAGRVLPAYSRVSALDFGQAQAFTACAFSQSLRNFSRPMLVSGWL
jgi:hypothetical protein